MQVTGPFGSVFAYKHLPRAQMFYSGFPLMRGGLALVHRGSTGTVAVAAPNLAIAENKKKHSKLLLQPMLQIPSRPHITAGHQNSLEPSRQTRYSRIPLWGKHPLPRDQNRGITRAMSLRRCTLRGWGQDLFSGSYVATLEGRSSCIQRYAIGPHGGR